MKKNTIYQRYTTDDPRFLLELAKHATQLMEKTIRKWEMIAYPTLFAFILLCSYGFYMIFLIAKDIHFLALSHDANMTPLSSSVAKIEENLSLCKPGEYSRQTHINPHENKQ
jgi:hypothetical protein